MCCSCFSTPWTKQRMLFWHIYFRVYVCVIDIQRNDKCELRSQQLSRFDLCCFLFASTRIVRGRPTQRRTPKQPVHSLLVHNGYTTTTTTITLQGLCLCVVVIAITAAYVERKFANIALFEDLYANVVRKMESVFESYLGVQEGISAVVSEQQQPDDIPKTNDPVWILGKQYCAIQGKPAGYTLRILRFALVCCCYLVMFVICIRTVMQHHQNSQVNKMKVNFKGLPFSQNWNW